MAPDGTPGSAPPQQPGQGEEEQSPLQRFGRDLTEMAEQGRLDPVIGRDEEIRRVIQVLSRRTKNNPVLIGEPGVGSPSASSLTTSPSRCATVASSHSTWAH
jgi:ATP-dependent Clp protease ATP-binding subunit ClpB